MGNLSDWSETTPFFDPKGHVISKSAVKIPTGLTLDR